MNETIKEEINELEEKLNDYDCIVQTTKEHEAENSHTLFYNTKTIKISYGEHGKIVNYDNSNPNKLEIKVIWEKGMCTNYYPKNLRDVPFEIIKYLPKDNPAQQRLFLINQ